MRSTVLGAPADILTKSEFLEEITKIIQSTQKMKLLVTAYSEFYVQGTRDTDFLNIMRKADLVTPDGVSVLAAVKYMNRAKGKSLGVRLGQGIRVGSEILAGSVGETVTGVWLFENLTKMAEKNNWKVFLLGGWDGVCEKTARMLLKRFPKLKLAYDAGETRVGTDEAINKRVLEKINDFAPDILFVAYNPIKQEKWLAKHQGQLKVKMGMGVGGTFDEYAGKIKKAPRWMENMGLKWLWRVMIEPKRFGRIMRAVVVFPWLVFRDSK